VSMLGIVTRSSVHHGALRLALIELAVADLKRGRHEELSFRDLAVRLGVSHNAPYRHFASKDDFLRALAEFGLDQLLVKEPNTAKRTPWHQDLPYWPTRGEQILSLWVPLDAATPENGVVTYVKGSHRWQAFFPIDEWSDNATQLADNGISSEEMDTLYRPGPDGATLADIRDRPERDEFLTWNVEPGDVLVHHPLVVHGAPGNLSNNHRRRAIATRWFGDDARWDESRPHFLRIFRKMAPQFPYPALETGDRIEDPLFPVVWER